MSLVELSYVSASLSKTFEQLCSHNNTHHNTTRMILHNTNDPSLWDTLAHRQDLLQDWNYKKMEAQQFLSNINITSDNNDIG
jgi:hypothetical protein